MTACSLVSPGSRRRTFWTTQLTACGTHDGECNASCGSPGLSFVPVTCTDDICECCTPPDVNPQCLDAAQKRLPRTFVTTEWIKSLALNILMTDARLEDKPCGYVPGTQGGHWSESFRTDNLKIGSLVRNLPFAASMRESIALVKARLIVDMTKLVTMGLATSIKVEVTYTGGRQAHADIIIYGQSGDENRVGLSGTRLNNTWAWA